MITIFSDLHVHAFSAFDKIVDKRSARLSGILDAANRIKDAVAALPGKNSTLFAGDLFHTFSSVENTALNGIIEILKDWPGPFIFVPGNHDLKSRTDYASYEVGAAALEKISKNIKMLNGEIFELAEGPSVYGLGWRSDKDFLNHTFKEADILLAHQLVKVPDFAKGLDVDAVTKNYRLSIFGDNHKPGLYPGGILSPGAPLQHSFKDEGQERGYWTWSGWGAQDLAFHPLKSKKFVTVNKISEVKQDGNFYRVREPAAKGTVPENAIVQEDVKHEFRNSGLSLEFTDDKLIRSYLDEAGKDIVNKDDYYLPGFNALKGCISEVVTPQPWRLKRIVMENFISFKGMHTFDFGPGMYLVLGANGFGKTTLFEGVNWGLWGSMTKDGSADDVVNDIEGKNCNVILYLENDAMQETLEICRYRKHDEFKNDFWFNVGGCSKIRRESTAETQKELEKVLGMNQGLFKSLNYFSQENFEFFSTMQDTGQKEICKSIMPLDRFEKAQLIFKVKVKEQEAQLESLASKSAKVLWELTSKQTALTEAAVKATIFEQDKAKVVEEKFVIWNDKSKEQLRTAAAYDAMTVELAELKTKQPPYDSTSWDTQIQSLTLEKETAVKAWYALVQEGEKEWNDKKNAGSLLLADIRELERTHFKITNMLTTFKQERDKLPTIDTVCFTCGQSLPLQKVEELRKQQADFIRLSSANIKAKEAELNELRAQQTKKNKMLEFAEGEADELRAKIYELRGKCPEHEFNTKILFIQNKREEARTAVTAEYDKALGLLTQKHGQLSREVDWTLMAAGEAKDALEAEKIKENIWEKEKVNLKRQLDELQGKQEMIQEAQEEEQKQLQVYRFWEKGFSNQGIVSLLLDSFARTFTDLMNEVLLNISRGKYYAILSTQKKLKSGEYREKFELSVYVEGRQRLYPMLSGGQKARINLATVIVLNKLIMRYFGFTYIPMGLWILDELFTGLDAEGIESTYFELESFSRDIAIYSIVHEEKMKSYFNQTIIVDYDKETGTKLTV